MLDDDECRSVTMEAGEKKDGSERRPHPFLQGRRKDGPRKNFLQIQGCATRWGCGIRPEAPGYSCRSAAKGSILVARRAGT